MRYLRKSELTMIPITGNKLIPWNLYEHSQIILLGSYCAKISMTYSWHFYIMNYYAISHYAEPHLAKKRH